MLGTPSRLATSAHRARCAWGVLALLRHAACSWSMHASSPQPTAPPAYPHLRQPAASGHGAKVGNRHRRHQGIANRHASECQPGQEESGCSFRGRGEAVRSSTWRMEPGGSMPRWRQRGGGRAVAARASWANVAAGGLELEILQGLGQPVQPKSQAACGRSGRGRYNAGNWAGEAAVIMGAPLHQGQAGGSPAAMPATAATAHT